MKQLPRVIALFAIVLMASQIVHSQNCYYGNGSIYGEQPYYWDTYTVGESMPVSWSLDWGYNTADATISIDISTDAGNSWVEVATGINMEENCGGCWSGSTSITIPWTIQPSNQCIVRFREVPNDASSCAYNYNGYNYYNQSYDYGYYFTILPGCYQPAITQQPPDQIGCIGYTSILHAGVDLGPVESTFQYDWFNGATLVSSSTTDPDYTMPSVSTEDAGIYKLVVANQCSNGMKYVTSRMVNFTVQDPAYFVTEPQNTNICPGTNATLTGIASGNGITYQWLKNGISIPGETNNTLTITGANTSDAGTYNLTIQGACGPVTTSSDAIITVPSPPTIVEQPIGGGFCRGSYVEVSAEVEGSGLHYQWYKYDSPVPGANQSTLIFNSIQASQSGYYWLRVTGNTDGCISVTTSEHVNVYTYGPPVITQQPPTFDLCTGSEGSLFVAAEGTDLHYLWYRNGSPIPNSDNYMLMLSNATIGMTGDYFVDVFSICNGSVRSNTSHVNVYVRPVIIAQPVSTTLNIHDKLTLSVTASGVRTVTWLHNAEVVARGSSTVYTKPNVALSDGGYYNAIVENECGTVTSQVARVQVTDPASRVPILQINTEGMAAGNVPFGYEQQKTFNNLISNTGSAPLIVTNMAFIGGDASDFSLINSVGSFTLLPGESASLTTRFHPSTVGYESSALVITSNATQVPAEVGIFGRGVVLYSMTSPLSFGQVNVGASQTLCLKITNTSTIGITIDQVTSSNADFTVASDMPLSIGSGATVDVCIAFAPSAIGQMASTLSFISTTGGNSTTDASGTGVPITGINEDVGAHGMSVYPNPAAGTVTINTGSEVARTISILDLYGQAIATIIPTQSITMWDLRAASGIPVASGTYTLVIETEGGVHSLGLMITR